jgi:hypothetical protein
LDVKCALYHFRTSAPPHFRTSLWSIKVDRRVNIL